MAEFKAPAEEKKPEEKKPEPKKEEKKPDAAAAGKPINAKCPVKGEPVNAEISFTYKGQVIGFC